MKVAILCDSPLLDKALKNFLKDSITPIANSDVVISDKKREIHKPLFIIGSDEDVNLRKPFSKATLILQLERFSEDGSNYDMHSLDDLKVRIGEITEEYLQKVYDEIDRFANP